jgi:chitodextrinase
MKRRTTSKILSLGVGVALGLTATAAGSGSVAAKRHPLVTQPTNVQVDVGDSSVTVAWDASMSDAGVEIYFVKLDGRWLWTVEPSITLFLERSTKYTLSVQAQDAAYNRSDWSIPISFTTSDAFPVTTPANVLTTGQPGSLTVTWDAATSDAGMMDYLVEVAGGQLGQRTTSTIATLSLPAGGEFEVTVKARDNAYRWSDTSDPIQVTVAPADDWAPPSAPTNLRATFDPLGERTLVEWDASTGGSGTLTYDLIVVEYNNTPIESTTQLSLELLDFGECQPGDPQPLTFVVVATSKGFESPPSNPITMCFA